MEGKLKKVALDPERYPNDAARAEFARRKSVEIQAMRLDKREGVTSVPVRDALTRYLAERRGDEMRARTLKDYARIGTIFADWCDANRVTFTREISAATLAAFRTDRVTQPNSKDTTQLRSANAVNVELRATHTMLRTWNRNGWTPQLSKDAIGDSLRQKPVITEEISFLKPAECRALLRAWIAHDRELFKMTRKEKRKELPPATPRWPAMAPFVATVMLTGMRLGEALGLTWADVNLDDGVISLRASATKTKVARRFDLEVSPGLRALLDALHLTFREARNRVQGELAPAPHVSVFGVTLDQVEAARKRLGKRETRKLHLVTLLEGDALPEWSWQTLRRTAATALANMRSVGPWPESKMLGHSVNVAERLYAGRMKSAADAKTIEAALGVAKEVKQITLRVLES